MFARVLLKRTVSLKFVHRKHLYLALIQLNIFPECHVKQSSFTVSTKTNFCKDVNSLWHRKVHANEHSSKEGQQRNIETVELLNNINLDIKNFHRVKYEDAEMVIHFIKRGVIDEYDKYALLLLDWCSNLMPDVDAVSRISFAHSVWKVLERLGTEIGTKHYNALLRCYAANAHRVPVLKFLADMNEVVPDNTTYELLLECTCVVGDLEQAADVIQLMKDKNISISEATFNSLILGHARAGDIKSSLLTLDAMYAANLLPSANTYTAVLQSYAEFGDIKNIKKYYEEAVSKNINFSLHQVMSICRTLALKQHHNIILEFVELMPEDLKKFTSTVQNTILELIHLRCEDAALSLMASMLPEVVYTTEHPCATFVYEMCRANIEPANIVNICSYLEKNEMYPRALYKAAEASLRLAKPDITLHVFQALVKNGAALRPHYFWPLFRQRAEIDGETGVLSTLKYMQALKVPTDFHTLLDYILPVIPINDPETTVQKLQECGVSVRQCLTPVAATLLLAGRLHSLLRLCDTYPTKMDFEKLLQPLVEAYVAKKNVEPVTLFLKAASKHTANDLAGHFLLELLTIKKTRYRNGDVIKLLQSFKDVGLPISSFASDVLIQYFKNGGTDSMLFEKGTALLESVTQRDLHISSAETVAVHIAHPRDMNLEELECHLLELKSKNMNTRGVLRHLLQLHAREGNAKRVLEVKKELEDAGFKFSLGMQASLFAMYVQLKDANSAGKCLNEIMQQSPDFIVDEHKIIDYAAVLVAENQYKAAVAVLERRAASGNIFGGKSISHNCWQLLNALAIKGEAEKVKHMFHLLRTLGFCSVTNILLGPLVRVYLARGDSDGAVREYQKCAAEFRKTPLQLELVSHLVEKASGSPKGKKLLEDTLAATTSVHGEANTFATYIVALAEHGKQKELRKFIAEHGSSIQYEGLLNRAKRLAKEDKLAPLLILADVCDNLPNFDTSLLYTFMLRVYDKHGDCDGAIKLWTKMQENNIQPSSEFLQSLSVMFRSHNKPTPFVSTNT